MADQMDIDTPSEEHHSKTTTTTTQPQQQTKPPPPKKTSSSSTRELTTCTIKHPPFSYVHLSTVAPEPPPEPEPQGSTTTPTETENLIDPLQVRSYCTAALRQFLGETGTSIVPDILLIAQRKQQSRSGSGGGRNGCRPTSSAQDIYLRLAREDLATFAAAMAAFPGSWTTTTTTSGNGKGGRLLLLQVQSCGDWLGGLIGKSEEVDVWGL